MKEKNILGIIGGMGPLATQVFYKMLIDKTEAKKDQDHIDTIILSHASIPDRTEAIISGDEEKVLTKLIEDARFLENAGASYIAITCNTSHHFVDKVSKEIKIPIINMIEETAKHIAGLKKESKVMIFATDGTIKTSLYQNALKNEGLIPVLPDAEGQSLVMSIIYDFVKAGKPLSDEIITKFKSLAKGKADFAVMACTELSCFKDQEKLDDFYIDAMEVLAEKSILLCGKKLSK